MASGRARMIAAVLVRFVHLAVSHVFTALWLLRMTEDRTLLAALLVPLGRATLRRFRLLVSPDAVLG